MNNLPVTYLKKEIHLAELQRELVAVEERLNSPSRTLDDFILHMQLIKERNRLINEACV